MLFVIIYTDAIINFIYSYLFIHVSFRNKKQPRRAVSVGWMIFEVKIGLPFLTAAESLFVRVHVRLR